MANSGSLKTAPVAKVFYIVLLIITVCGNYQKSELTFSLRTSLLVHKFTRRRYLKMTHIFSLHGWWRTS
ncbi:trp operon leader peptide [Cronobacter sakazakii]|uniref:trp operon leader peptide n=1 Tax=Cronobacter sakazakii TaxID=28141 RepID=UPI000DA19E29|nr:trp operon leader peptide [Cronobacter sakazakii]EJC1180652.1 trp operon leader peptide [Cronobacter sakazakii]EJC1240894.1 trp operon leader peptide [Cronobacter sakazakii]EJC2072920.1 trp operon leader peptide [Cronobacter sakazakii]EKK3979502.1 trp operon leader peptide [Cronobacter sakazakii]